MPLKVPKDNLTELPKSLGGWTLLPFINIDHVGESVLCKDFLNLQGKRTSAKAACIHLSAHQRSLEQTRDYEFATITLDESSPLHLRRLWSQPSLARDGNVRSITPSPLLQHLSSFIPHPPYPSPHPSLPSLILPRRIPFETGRQRIKSHTSTQIPQRHIRIHQTRQIRIYLINSRIDGTRQEPARFPHARERKETVLCALKESKGFHLRAGGDDVGVCDCVLQSAIGAVHEDGLAGGDFDVLCYRQGKGRD